MAMFFLLKLFRAGLGHDRYSAATFDRLVRSKHVGDLQWIVDVTVGAAVLAITVLGVIFAAEGVWANFSWVPATALLAGCGAVLAAVGGITAWCYQTGASRLGTIDLVACEITTLCRICTINGLADTCISAFAADTMSDKDKLIKMKEQFGDFDSSGTYTPFFDANAKELHSLSVKEGR